MSKKHVQVGENMTWTNSTGSAVAAGDVVVVADMVCIALVDIADGAAGELSTENVWNMPKEAPLVIAQGDLVYWDVANSNIDKTDTNVPCGKAFAAAASTDTQVAVKLNA